MAIVRSFRITSPMDEESALTLENYLDRAEPHVDVVVSYGQGREDLGERQNIVLGRKELTELRNALDDLLQDQPD